MSRKPDIVIVGCGIAGASLGFFLAEKGLKVAVYERDRPASGGTGASAAIMRQHYSTKVMTRLAKRAIEIVASAPERLGRSAGYSRAGYMFLAGPDHVAATRQNVEMQRALGVDTAMVGRDRLADRFPWLALDGVADAAYEPDGGYTDPQIATDAFIAAAVERGADFHPKTPVRAILREGARVTGVMTDTGPIQTGIVVNAAGPWAPALATLAGIELRMRTVREQDTVWEARGNRPLPSCSISNAVDSIYIRPLGANRYIVGRGFPKTYTDVDPQNYTLTADSDFIADVQDRMIRRIPTFEGARLIHSYAALYDVSEDWYQYVGPRAGLAGYIDFSGGSGHGFKEAPAIAEELAAILAGGPTAPDFAQFSYDRLAAGQHFVQAYGGNRG